MKVLCKKSFLLLKAVMLLSTPHLFAQNRGNQGRGGRGSQSNGVFVGQGLGQGAEQGAGGLYGGSCLENE